MYTYECCDDVDDVVPNGVPDGEGAGLQQLHLEQGERSGPYRLLHALPQGVPHLDGEAPITQRVTRPATVQQSQISFVFVSCLYMNDMS